MVIGRLLYKSHIQATPMPANCIWHSDAAAAPQNKPGYWDVQHITGLLDLPIEEVCAVAASRIITLLLKVHRYHGYCRKKPKQPKPKTQAHAQRGIYGNSTAVKREPRHHSSPKQQICDTQAPAEAAATCPPTCVFWVVPSQKSINLCSGNIFTPTLSTWRMNMKSTQQSQPFYYRLTQQEPRYILGSFI